MKYGKHKLTTNLLGIAILPLLIFGIIVTMITSLIIYNSLKNEVKDNLRILAYTSYKNFELLFPGDLSEKDHHIVKGDKSIEGQTQILDEIRELSGADITLFYHRERCLTTICKENGERARGTEASKEVSDQVLKKGRDFFSDNVMVNDTRYFGYYMPIKDSKNNISGMMFAGKPRKDILIEMSKSIAIIFCAAFITIIIAANIVFHYGKRVIGSLNQIKKFLKDIAEGDLTTKIDSKILDRQDEIGQMGRFSVMLKDSITDLVGTDSLTRLHNRRSCQVVLDSFENKYKKDGKDFVIAIGDIDFF